MKKYRWGFLAVGVFAIASYFLLHRLFFSFFTSDPGNSWIRLKSDDQELIAGEKSDLLFLLVGVDQDPTDPNSRAARSDTMMLVQLDFDTGEMDLVSLPRDSYVSVDGEMTKLNHAHFLGGIDLLQKTLEDWLHIKILYYVQVDFQAVVDIVDAMGGIEYEVPDIGMPYKYIEDDRWKTLPHGRYTLDGKQALAYLRYRKGYETGDIGRVHAQQEFLKVVAKRLLEEDKIKLIPTLLEVAFNKVDTNIPWHRILGLLADLSTLKEGKLETHTLPGNGEYIDNISYYLVDEDGKDALISDVFSNYYRKVD